MNIPDPEEKRLEIQALLDSLTTPGAAAMMGSLPFEKKDMPLDKWKTFQAANMNLSEPVGDIYCLRTMPVLDRQGNLRWRIRLLWALPWWDACNGVKAHRRIELDRWQTEGPYLYGVSNNGGVFFLQQFRFENSEDDELPLIRDCVAWRQYRKEKAEELAELDASVMQYELDLMREEDDRDG